MSNNNSPSDTVKSPTNNFPAAEAAERLELAQDLELQRLRIEELQADKDRLAQEVTELSDKVTSVRLRYRDAAEEFERAKERIARESKAEIALEAEKRLRLFLPIIDDLERAIASAETRPPQDDLQILTGVKLIRAKILHALEEQEVRPMEALGARFDAARFDAVGTDETLQPGDVGVVVDVVEPGYLLRDKVLRVAKVIVGTAGRQ